MCSTLFCLLHINCFCRSCITSLLNPPISCPASVMFFYFFPTVDFHFAHYFLSQTTQTRWFSFLLVCLRCKTLEFRLIPNSNQTYVNGVRSETTSTRSKPFVDKQSNNYECNTFFIQKVLKILIQYCIFLFI